MAALEVLALDEATPQIRAPGAGDTYTMPRPLAITGVAGTSALTITDATQTTSKPVLDLSQTVNAAGVTFEVFGKKTLTDTASATESRFESWYVGTALKASIRKDGAIHLWNLATDASNYERGFIRWASNVLEIGTEKAGTGSNRAVRIVTPNGGNEATFNSGTTIHAGLTCQSFLTASNYILSSVGLYLRSNTAYLRFGTADDVSFDRIAAGIVGVRNGSTGGAAISMVEQTAPAAPAANGVYIYAQDNGAGKTQLMALFASGAAQQIAIEP